MTWTENSLEDKFKYHYRFQHNLKFKNGKYLVVLVQTMSYYDQANQNSLTVFWRRSPFMMTWSG